METHEILHGSDVDHAFALYQDRHAGNPFWKPRQEADSQN
jgi:hypothetical protein